jgi:hypothetical protein
MHQQKEDRELVVVNQPIDQGADMRRYPKKRPKRYFTPEMIAAAMKLAAAVIQLIGQQTW